MSFSGTPNQQYFKNTENSVSKSVIMCVFSNKAFYFIGNSDQWMNFVFSSFITGQIPSMDDFLDVTR
jgi:hypothetical protein